MVRQTSNCRQSFSTADRRDSFSLGKDGRGVTDRAMLE
jgi:hypothetical protein